VEFISRQVGVPASIVSVGPDRRQTIIVPHSSHE
jgi:adenylosuccinate synthase